MIRNKVVVLEVIDKVLTIVSVDDKIETMNKKAEKKVRRMTQNQARVLRAIVSTPANMVSVGTSFISTATGLRANELGGTVSALERNGLIQPLGKDGRTFNWELSDFDLKKARDEDPQSLRDMLSRVSGDIRK